MLPQALPGILTGTILAMSRALGRSGADHRDQRARLSDIRSGSPVGAVHGAADTDIQLDIAPAGRVPRHRGGGYCGVASRLAYNERGSDNTERPSSGEIGCLETSTAVSPDNTNGSYAANANDNTNGEIVLRSDDVSVSYGSFRALKDISMDIQRHEVTALIGPSGCGKSTLLRCFNRMNDLIPGAHIGGRIMFEGYDLYGPDVDPHRDTLSNRHGLPAAQSLSQVNL